MSPHDRRSSSAPRPCPHRPRAHRRRPASIHPTLGSRRRYYGWRGGRGGKGSDNNDDDDDNDDDDNSHRPVVSSHSTGCTVAPPTPDGWTIKEDIILSMMIYDGKRGEERSK